MKHLHLFAALATFTALKLWHRSAGAEQLSFLLAPTSTLVALAGGGPGRWITGRGYYHASGDFLIDAGCAGFNFFCLSFAVFSLLLHTRLRLPWSLIVCLLAAWPVTLLANSSRILSSLWLSGRTPAGAFNPLLHQFQGGVVYLSFLCAAALATTYLLRPKTPFRAADL